MSPSEVTVLAEEQGSAGGSSGPGHPQDPAQPFSSPREPALHPTDTRPGGQNGGCGRGGLGSCRLLPCRPRRREGVDTGMSWCSPPASGSLGHGWQAALARALEPQITCWPKVG